MAARPADDAIARYMANRVREAEPKPPTKAQAAAAEAALARRSDEMNQKLLLGRYRVHTDSLTVDPETGIPIGDTTAPAQTDWSSYLSFFGLPADVLKEINAIFARTDVTQATALATGYVRGTPWYKTAYPGIQEAIGKGIVRDERDYRSRMNAFDQVYRQYAGRAIRPDEYADHLREGVDVSTVGQRFQGAALATSYGNDWQYAAGAFGSGRLDPTQLKALGEQQAGLGSPAGTGLQKMIEDATRKLRRSFEGVLATTALAGTPQERARQAPDIGR